MTARSASTPRSSRSTAAGPQRLLRLVRVIPTGAGMCATEITGMNKTIGAGGVPRSSGRSRRRSSPWHGDPVRLLGTRTSPSGSSWPARARTRAGSACGCSRRLSSRGYKPGFLGADRGYTQVLAEHFHLPVRAIGYRIVMDYKRQDLGRQANSGGAVLVDGCFYCPAMPEALVSASGDHRAGTIDEATFTARLKARASYRLVRKSGPDADGYERYSCPAVGGHPHVVCPLRPTSSAAVGKIPVLSAPLQPPKVCTQQAITIAPDVGGAPPPGARLRDRGMGTHLRHLPQHDRGLERLCERRRA